MKITVSKSQWEEMGKKAGWMKTAESEEIPCSKCGKKTKMTETKLCDGCWEEKRAKENKSDTK